jgi:tetratricopeptide (TPR) repeat protein
LALGDVLHRMKDDAAAIEHYRQAIEMGPVRADAHVRMGLAYQSNDKAAAERQFRRALELRPHFVEAEFNLAILLDSLGRSEEAILYLRDATALKPDFAKAKLALAQILEAKEQAPTVAR